MQNMDFFILAMLALRSGAKIAIEGNLPSNMCFAIPAVVTREHFA
jgi:hypothetical protein